MSDQQEESLKNFLQTYQADENLKQYRQFVNVYAPREEDIQAIHLGNFEISGLKTVPSPYGEGSMFEFRVGQTSYRIWGQAFKYIQQAEQASGPAV